MLLEDFLTSAGRHPDKTAVICDGSQHSYARLRHQLLRTAAWFQQRIDPGDRVALLLDNSADYITSYYAVWAAGGVVVGLNTALKDEDILALLQHCDAAVVVVDGGKNKRRSALADADIAVLLTGSTQLSPGPGETSLAGLEAPPSTQALYQGDPEDLASIIYTSGTTGKPKGVMLSHDNLAQNVKAIQRYLEINGDDRVMCVLPFYYSYGNSVLHTHISCGACLVLENSLMYPHRVLKQMQELKVTGFYGVPSTYYLLLARTRLDSVDLSGLRYCAQAGGPMNGAKIEQWLACLPATAFVVMYGQTEASARLTWLPPARREDKPGSVGIAIDGMELCIMDAKGHRLPPGDQGEVCVRGTSTMSGYWRDETATATVLRDGWLHTGDLGYLDEEDFLFLVGRSREMIKTGAHRVSPREIEETVAEVEGVVDVAVIGVDDDILGQVIKACVIADRGGATLEKAILRRCRQRLATYKIPKIIEFLGEFPRTASGKIQKHRLK